MVMCVPRSITQKQKADSEKRKHKGERIKMANRKERQRSEESDRDIVGRIPRPEEKLLSVVSRNTL